MTGRPGPHPDGQAPSWTDPVVREATGVIGGPLGRYAVTRRRGLAGVAATLVALATVVLALGVLQKGHCLIRGWSGPDHFWRACYSDLPVVHVSSPLADAHLPWSGGIPSNQPPLSGLVMWLVAQLPPTAGVDVAAQRSVLIAWVVLCLLLLVAAVVAAVSASPHRPWQAAHVAVSPVLVTLALVSTDLLGVTLTLLAVWAWRSDRPWWAGVLLGLAALVRPFPLLFLIAFALLAWRRGDRTRSGQLVVGGVLGALVVVVPLVALQPAALTGARDWWFQGAGFGAVQIIPQLLGLGTRPGVPVGLAVLGWAVAIAIGAVSILRAKREPAQVHRVVAVMMVVVVLTAPGLSVQSGLWILPLLALSGLGWWPHLVWALVETVHFVATWLHLAFSADPGRGLPPQAYALVVLIRIAAWAWILWTVAQESGEDQPSPSTRPSRSEVESGLSSLRTTSGTT